jgi:hypothetical protein
LQAARVVHGSGRVVETNFGTGLMESNNGIDRWSFADVISVGLESNSPKDKRFAFEIVLEMLHHFREEIFLLLFIHFLNCFHNLETKAVLFRCVNEGLHIFRET